MKPLRTACSSSLDHYHIICQSWINLQAWGIYLYPGSTSPRIDAIDGDIFSATALYPRLMVSVRANARMVQSHNASVLTEKIPLFAAATSISGVSTGVNSVTSNSGICNVTVTAQSCSHLSVCTVNLSPGKLSDRQILLSASDLQQLIRCHEGVICHM